MKYWENKSQKDKLKMVDVFKEQIIYLEKVVPNFKVANATIHFDESSPHLHIIGVPYKDNCKTGLSRQVGKSDVFTKESLTIIQDQMRVYCINSFNKVYSLKEELKENKKTINKLEKENNKLKDKIGDLKDELEKSKDEINSLKSTINSLKNTISYWKDKFDKLISFLYSKLHNWYDKEDKYIGVVNDMYEDNVLDDEDLEDIGLSKEKDDCEL